MNNISITFRHVDPSDAIKAHAEEKVQKLQRFLRQPMTARVTLSVDKLEQERVGALGGDVRSYRVVASGFCTEPANSLNDKERIVVSSFDFAGRLTYAPTSSSPKGSP